MSKSFRRKSVEVVPDARTLLCQGNTCVAQGETRITDAIVPSLVQLLADEPLVTTLNLRSARLSDVSLCRIADSFSPRLTDVNLSNVPLSEEVVAAVTEVCVYVYACLCKCVFACNVTM